MTARIPLLVGLTLQLLVGGLAAAQESTDESVVVRVKRGPEAAAELQSALASAVPGTVIQLPAGTLSLEAPLVVATERLMIRGKGRKDTVLDFGGLESGEAGLRVEADRVTLESFRITDPPGAGVHADGVEFLTLRDLQVGWSGGRSSDDGDRGLHVTDSQYVLIEDCRVAGASEAGIGVDESTDVVLRRNKVAKSVVGIALGNASDVDVKDNALKKNSVGVLVFNAPDRGVLGAGHRIFKNRIVANNEENVGTGTVGRLAPGTGIAVVAHDRVEIFKNEIRNHNTIAVGIASYNLFDPGFEDEAFDPYSETVFVHDNAYANNGSSPNDGSDPDDLLGFLIGALFEGSPPDVLLAVDEDPEKQVDGALPPELQVCVEEDRRKTTFGTVNLVEVIADPEAALEVTKQRARRLGEPYRCGHPRLGKVVLPDPDAFEDLFLSDRFLNISHRGGRWLWPEHTLVAYEGALDAGTDVLELDVHSTSDGELVVLHDDTVDRTTDGTGAVLSLTLAEVKALDAGHDFSQDGGATYPYRGTGVEIPTVREVFEAFPDEWYVIELKQESPSIAQRLIDLIEEFGLERKVILAAFDDATIAEARALAPEIHTSLAETEVYQFYLLNLQSPEAQEAYVPPGLFLHVPRSSGGLEVLTRPFVRRASRYGMKIHAWTINEPDEMRRLIELGVDGIMTDDPVTLDAVIAEYE